VGQDGGVRAVRCVQGAIQVVDAPEPEGEVGVRVVSAGICGSDHHLISQGFVEGRIIGHEVAGLLDDGTPVAIEPVAGCGVCERCVRGDYHVCGQPGFSIRGISDDGGMAERMAVPASAIVALPSGVRAEDACLVEPLAVAAHGFRLLDRRDDLRRVAVLGGGAIGQCAVAVAAAQGARPDLVARYDHQRSVGEHLGAGLPTDEPYDLVVECAGTESALAEAVQRCAPGGTILILAAYWDGMTVPGMELCLKEARLVPSSMYSVGPDGRDVDEAASVLAVTPALAPNVITHRYPLEAAETAFAVSADRAAGALKVVLEPQGDHP